MGRAPDNDIVIGDEFPNASSVADHHARISLRESWAVIEAINPDAPIYVNDQRTGRNTTRACVLKFGVTRRRLP